MVSAGLPLPVVKSVEDTVEVQSAPKPRLSVTWMVPRLLLMVAARGCGAEVAAAGAVRVRGPAMMPVMAVHWLRRSPGAVAAGAAEVAVLARMSFPVSGLLTVTE